MSIFCLLPALKVDWGSFGLLFWVYVIVAGFLNATGSICLIKALKSGELSILGPINSYKCVFGLLLGFMFLNEIPTAREMLGIALIIFGSWFLFDTTEEGFSISLFTRKDIQLRFFALFLSALETVFLKKIIIMSSFTTSFILWCFCGFLFSFFIMLALSGRFYPIKKCNIGNYIFIALSLGTMQLATNFLIGRINIGLMFALFQLSSIVSLFLGWKIFNEKDMAKKLLGTMIMILSASMVLL